MPVCYCGFVDEFVIKTGKKFNLFDYVLARLLTRSLKTGKKLKEVKENTFLDLEYLYTWLVANKYHAR